MYSIWSHGVRIVKAPDFIQLLTNNWHMDVSKWNRIWYRAFELNDVLSGLRNKTNHEKSNADNKNSYFYVLSIPECISNL